MSLATNTFGVDAPVTVLIAPDGAEVRKVFTRILGLARDGLSALLLIPGETQTRWVDVADLMHTYSS